jgi:Glutamyl- and glutaminyl-tRNA synthetases
VSIVTRFAPSPTGDLHLGHAYAAWFASTLAARSGGRFLVRIEDIDVGRCRDEFIARNLEDLAWLGLRWEEPVLRQSARMAQYRAALDRLDTLGVTYPCLCTRKQIQAEIAAAAGAPHAVAAVYPGLCRGRARGETGAAIAAGAPYAIRLDAARALAVAGDLVWTDADRGSQPVDLAAEGDVVIARKEMPTSYHLAVVVDDAAQGVTHVTRGEDLFGATHVHRLLYALLGLDAPIWHHHALCRDASGRRLAKRSRDLAIGTLRARGLTPAEVLAMATEAAVVHR